MSVTKKKKIVKLPIDMLSKSSESTRFVIDILHNELKKLHATSGFRELTLDELKKLDTLVRNLATQQNHMVALGKLQIELTKINLEGENQIDITDLNQSELKKLLKQVVDNG
jgi:uncharacterized protein YcbK (DUF882 family)